jgi:hypothetical protein
MRRGIYKMKRGRVLLILFQSLETIISFSSKSFNDDAGGIKR